MSIRAEDAALEASKFSLRTSFLAQRRPSAAAPHAPLPHAPHASPAPHARTPPHALASLRRTRRTPPLRRTRRRRIHCSKDLFLCERRRRQAGRKHSTAAARGACQGAADRTVHCQDGGIAAHASTPAPTPPPTNSQRLLPGGFLNGGTVRNDAQAEVLRLSATIEALNSKYSAQSERLARTEASLVRANRAVTSERATSNARLKLQNELKEMKHKEAKLQETALARRELSKTDVAFSESAKRAEAMDAELCELRERAAALATARTELLAKVSELSTSLESATQRTATMDAELAANRPSS